MLSTILGSGNIIKYLLPMGKSDNRQVNKCIDERGGISSLYPATND